MLFILFFLITLVCSTLFVVTDTVYFIFYILYFIFYYVNYNNTNVISSTNFKYVLKNTIIVFFAIFCFFKSFFSTYFSLFGFNIKPRWKPLFKRSSYFGLYRATRNQFLNK